MIKKKKKKPSSLSKLEQANCLKKKNYLYVAGCFSYIHFSFPRFLNFHLFILKKINDEISSISFLLFFVDSLSLRGHFLLILLLLFLKTRNQQI